MCDTVRSGLQKELLVESVMGGRENRKEAGEGVMMKTAVGHRIGVGG